MQQRKEKIIKENFHTPVMINEILEQLQVKSKEKYVDATLGGGGHSLEILKRGGKILGFDQDPQAIEESLKNFDQHQIDPHQYCLIKRNFSQLKETVQEKKWQPLDGIIFDLGTSMWQIKNSKKGFSFQEDEFLDMRMNPATKVTAYDLVNGLNQKELTKLLRTYGDEKNARNIAQNIVDSRRLAPIKTAKELAEIVQKTKGYRFSGKKRIHPATLTFQALRIAVNDELNNLKQTLPQAFEIVKPGGKIIIISFHSGEDRIVKQFFKEKVMSGQAERPFKKPLPPSEKEKEENPASRSAKLRVLIKNNES